MTGDPTQKMQRNKGRLGSQKQPKSRLKIEFFSEEKSLQQSLTLRASIRNAETAVSGEYNCPFLVGHPFPQPYQKGCVSKLRI